MDFKVVSVSLPVALVHKLDEAAKEEFTTRSEFVRQSIVEQLRLVDTRRAQLAAVVAKADAPTEAEIFRLLKLKQQRRYARQLGRELRSGPSAAD